MWFFAITVKNNSIPIDKLNEGFYDDWRSNAEKKNLSIKTWTFEYDENWRLHMHALGTYMKPNMWKKSFEMKGYHQHILPLAEKSDVANWMQYMYKDYDYKEQRERFHAVLEHQEYIIQDGIAMPNK